MDSKKDIKIKGNLTLEDYSDLNKIYMRNIFKKMIGVIFVSFLVMYGILFYKRYGLVFVGIASLLGSVFVYLSIYIATTIKTKRSFKKNSPNKFHFTYTINKNGIHVQSESGGRQHYWKNVSDSVKYNNVYIFYINKSQSILIPERFFKNSSEHDDFKKLLIANFENPQID